MPSAQGRSSSSSGTEQVVLGVADQVLHDPLGLRLLAWRRSAGARGLMGLDGPPLGLVRRIAERGPGRSLIGAYISVGGNHVHAFRRVPQWKPLRGGVRGSVGTATVTTQTLPSATTRREGWDFYLATSRDLDLATSGDFCMATGRAAPGTRKYPSGLTPPAYRLFTVAREPLDVADED